MEPLAYIPHLRSAGMPVSPYLAIVQLMLLSKLGQNVFVRRPGDFRLHIAGSHSLDGRQPQLS